jgi:Arc/MetJ family transcription regulator
MCMRTNIVLDDDLVREAMRLTGIKTQRALVHEALRTLVETRRRRSLTALRGKIKLAAGYDYKAARGRS